MCAIHTLKFDENNVLRQLNIHCNTSIQLNRSPSSNFRICSMHKSFLLIQHINSSGASCSSALPGSLVAAIAPLYSTLYIELIKCVFAKL